MNKKSSSIKSEDIAIQLTNISKKYEIHHEKPTLVEKFVKGRNETFWALKDINLTIKKGEKVGIIGPNGAGKTTLLKIISGITIPTHGTVHTYGKVVSLIDLGAGFSLDLSGLQNIYLNAMLLGVTKNEIDLQLENIINYADIKQFIDIPLYTYSQGMKLRLGFSIAAHINPDILIIDENIIVGDQNFQKKVLNKINSFIKLGKTILIVSQWEDYIKNNCNIIITLQKGSIITKELK